MLPALIGLGGQLLGGLLGRDDNTETKSYQGIVGQARGAREAGEKYGFNPLTLLGHSAPIMGVGGNPALGSAIADASMLLADKVAEDDELGIEERLERENRELREHIERQTLRPVVGGVYNRQVETPTISRNQDPIMGEREIETTPATNTAGAFQIENRLTGGPVYLPGDGDPWGIDEFLTAGFFGLPQIFGNWVTRPVERAYREELRRARENPRFTPWGPRPQRN